MANYVAVRTRFFDDSLDAATDAGCQQVVILAAGLDARAFRLPWLPTSPFSSWICPTRWSSRSGWSRDTTRHRPCARRVPLAVDLRADWADPLRHAGFDLAYPSAWLAEGILMYLIPGEVTGC